MREVTKLLITSPTTTAISIHTSREGSDFKTVSEIEYILIFQSTLPVREVTNRHERQRRRLRFQSTLPVREVTW